MLASSILIALVGASTAFASSPSEIHHLVTRQAISSSSIPSACQSGCSSALSIYNACLGGNTQTCLSVCQADTFNNFVSCFNCVIQNTPGATSSDYQQLQAAVNQLQTACNQAGQSVSAPSLTGGAAVSTGSGAGASSGAIAASFTSATSGITIGTSASAALSSGVASRSSAIASASSGGGAVAGVSSSAAGGASAASSAPAASSSKSAGQAAAILPKGFASAGIALVAIGAGAAMVL